jgi:Flp pilus assembly protein TadD
MKPEEWKNHRSNISYTYYLLGDWEEAEAVTKELATEFPDSIIYKGNLGAIAARKGNIEEARRVFQMLGEVTAAWRMPQAKFRQSLIAALLGEKDTAVRLIKEVLDMGWDYGPSWLVNPDYESLRDFAPFVKLFATKG